MIFVFLCRQVLDDYSSKQWQDYDYDDYVFNKRAFSKWIKYDIAVMHKCDKLQSLDETGRQRPKRKMQSFVASRDKSPNKVFKVHIDLDSSDSDE